MVCIKCECSSKHILHFCKSVSQCDKNGTLLFRRILQRDISYPLMQLYHASCYKYTASSDYNYCNISSETKGSMFLAHILNNSSIQHYEKRRNTQEKKIISIDSVNTEKQTTLITKC